MRSCFSSRHPTNREHSREYAKRRQDLKQRKMTVDEDAKRLSDEASDSSEPANWTSTIVPHEGLFSVPVRELWNYRDLLVLLVRRDLVAFYKQTILGPAWFILQPLLTAMIFYVIFGQIADLPTNGTPKFLFYLLGVTFWNFFAECFTKTSETFMANAPLFSKVYFPRLIVPLAIIVSNMFRFSIQLTLLLLVWGASVFKGEVSPSASILLFPFCILLMASIGLGVGLVFTAATTKYRDLKFLIVFGVQLLMYATPIIYPVSMVRGPWLYLVQLNPLTSLFELLRHGWLGVGDFSALGLIWSTIFAAGALMFGVLLFNLTERTYIDTV